MEERQIEKTAWGVTALGALISSVSVLADPNIITQSSMSGIEYHPALLSPHGLILGNALFVAGLALQFIEKLNRDERVKTTPYIYFVLTSLVVGILLLQLVLQRLLFI